MEEKAQSDKVIVHRKEKRKVIELVDKDLPYFNEIKDELKNGVKPTQKLINLNASK